MSGLVVYNNPQEAVLTEIQNDRSLIREKDGHDGVGQNRTGAVAPAAKCRRFRCRQKHRGEQERDGPVLMLNMNRYSLESGFPDRGVYQQYISGLGNFLEGAGAKLLWRFPVLGQAVGDQRIHEIIACWYPVHKYFSISTRRRALRKTSV